MVHFVRLFCNGLFFVINFCYRCDSLNVQLIFQMMACSYLSATSFKPESSATCWTPPRVEAGQNAFRPELEPEMDSVEPALDLTTSFKPKPPSDDNSE